MRRSSLTLVAVCAGWGTIPLVVRRVDLPPVAIVFARVWVATLALGAISAVPGLRSERTTAARGGRARVLAAGALLAVHWTSMFAGYQSAPDDTVVFVVFLAPVGIALVAPRALGERLSPRTIGALALAVAGFALVAGPALEPASAGGLAWATLSAATFVALVLVSKPLAEVHGGLRLNLLEMSVAGVLLIPAALAADWTGIGRAWPWLVLLGLAHTAVGITLYLRTLARVPATHVGILGYVEPVSVVVLAWLVLGDRPSPTTVIGGTLVIAAGALVILGERTSQEEAVSGDLVPALATAPEVPTHVPR